VIKKFCVFLIFLFVFLDSSVANVFADPAVVASKVSRFEDNIYLEREPFTWFEPTEKKNKAEDVQGDVVVFDRNNQHQPLSLIADIKSMSIEQVLSGWKISFELWDEIPADPGMPVNFHVFFDADSKTENNAPDGVFRAGTDTAYILLFGTKTKWHALGWVYDSTTKKWTQRTPLPTFEIAPKNFSMTIPFDIIKAGSLPKVRAMSLTSDLGITAIDVIPGNALPKPQASK